MTDRNLLYAFWDSGDNDIIEFAILKARLNRHERDVIHLILDECMTQEAAAEHMGFSVRRTQEFWYSATAKILHIPWVTSYAKELLRRTDDAF